MNSKFIGPPIEAVNDAIQKGVHVTFPSVNTIGLKRLKHKMTQSPEAIVTEEEWDKAEFEYRRFLSLKQVYPGVSLVPSKQVDQVWHAHILDTHAYREDCNKLFGRFIDHYPYFGIYGKEDNQALQESFDVTKSLYERHFGPYPKGDDAVASRCEEHACHVPSQCACRVAGTCK